MLQASTTSLVLLLLVALRLVLLRPLVLVTRVRGIAPVFSSACAHVAELLLAQEGLQEELLLLHGPQLLQLTER